VVDDLVHVDLRQRLTLAGRRGCRSVCASRSNTHSGLAWRVETESTNQKEEEEMRNVWRNTLVTVAIAVALAVGPGIGMANAAPTQLPVPLPEVPVLTDLLGLLPLPV
jgi:anti-sigma-K factor RskA